MAVVVSFGEIMARISTEGYYTLRQSLPGNVTLCFAGAEANVAASIALLGGSSRYVTALPENDITEACIGNLRNLGIDTSNILKKNSGRLGIYFVQTGADQRPGKVIYDRDAKPTQRLASWDWDSRESSGSQKAMHLSGPILWALANGGTLVIDEVEAFLHPIMTLNTIEIFLNKGSNPQNAQLIFATHDTNLLSYAKLRRDQFYFAEKNAWESTEIFSLSDFKYIGEKDGHPFTEKERPDSDKERRYIEGRYGAIPVLGKFNDFIRNIKWQDEVQ